MNPNKIARERIKNMPSFAGHKPRTAFNLDVVMPADLDRKPLEDVVGLKPIPGACVFREE
jgi:hypothetical protein